MYLLRGKSFKSTRHSRKITDEHTCTFLHDDDAVFIRHSLERLQPRFVFEFEERSQFAVSSFLMLALKKLQSSYVPTKNGNWDYYIVLQDLISGSQARLRKKTHFILLM